MIDVSICIVNYKADKELKRCVESIRKFTRGVSYEIIVIDNSADNRWYCGGNNLAAGRARGKYVLFLNPDCRVTDDAISELASFMEKHPSAGAAEPRQVYESGETAPTGSLLPRWWIDLTEMTGLSRWFGRLGAPAVRLPLPKLPASRRGVATAGFGRTSGFLLSKNPGPSEKLGKISIAMMKYRQAEKDRRKNWETEVVSGAAMMVRKEILDRIGGFDERLKLYYTDVDLCRRIKAAGWEIWHAGEIEMKHKTRASTSKLPWNRLNFIYAQDAREYYRKWGERVGGEVLYWGMVFNQLTINFLRFIKARPSDGRPGLFRITAIIIASVGCDKKKLERAIESTVWADEVMVEEVKTPIKDFSRVRNEALNRAKNEWVLFLDSDEEISEVLAEEIKRTVLAVGQGLSFADGFYFKRRDKFLGKWLKHGETGSVRLLRLARKNAGRWERPVHEVWKVGARVGEFEHPIRHYSHENVDTMVEKLDGYSEIEAEYRLGKLGIFGKLGLLGEMTVFPVAKFIQNYFLRLGFLDGIEGLIHALMMSWHSLLVRGKILARYESTNSSE